MTPLLCNARATTLLVLALFAGATLLSAQQVSLRILVTNDDGYESPGLTALVGELATLGEVVVAAPSANRSGSSHSYGSTGEPIAARRVEIAGATEAWSVDATPAVATAFGLAGPSAARGFDLVVSGINRGANVGEISHLSGTVGAAMEAIYRGVPGIAVSQDATSTDFGAAARFTAALVRRLSSVGFPPGTVLSINVPAQATRGDAEAVAVPMGGSYFVVDAFTAVEGTDHYRLSPRLVSEAPPGSDTEAYLAGKITVTPLGFDWTDRELLARAEEWLPHP